MPLTRSASEIARRNDAPRFGPNLHIETRLHISSHPVGWLFAFGLCAIILLGAPVVLVFFIPALLLGGLIGLVLYLKHR